MSDGRAMTNVVMTFAASGPDPADRDFVMKHEHDELIATCPVRLGPVSWRWYAPDAAAELLQKAGIDGDPNAPGLIAFLEANPDAELLVTSVEVP